MKRFLLSIFVVLALAVGAQAFGFGLNLNFAGGRGSLFFGESNHGRLWKF